MEKHNLKVTNCECQLALHFLKKSLNQPRPYSYIGVSKLSCRGCDIFPSALNKVYGSKFYAKGCHHKWYYPWRFPPLPQMHVEVAEEMYKQLCMKFSRTYDGFRIAKSEILSDSEAASGDDWGRPAEPNVYALLKRLKETA